ncbi:MAG: nuclear transport factor 2 family protein [Cyanobacteria bacterium P01_D01_bin.56]
MDISTRITAPIVKMVHAIDSLDWQGVRHTFADVIDVDYTSLTGGEPETIPTDLLMERWRSLLPGFEATQHLLGPFGVDTSNELAKVGAHVRGFHYIANATGGSVWIVAGHYNFGLVQQADDWAIAAIQLVVFYQEGNLDLPALAHSRATNAPRKS